MRRLVKLTTLIFLVTTCEVDKPTNSTSSEIFSVVYDVPFSDGSGTYKEESYYYVTEFQYNEHDFWRFHDKSHDKYYLIHSPECKKCNPSEVEESIFTETQENSYWGW